MRWTLKDRDDAFALVRADPELRDLAHAALKRRVRQVFSGGARLGLVDMG